jgi:hypothetical protein
MQRPAHQSIDKVVDRIEKEYIIQHDNHVIDMSNNVKSHTCCQKVIVNNLIDMAIDITTLLLYTHNVKYIRSLSNGTTSSAGYKNATFNYSEISATWHVG